MAAAAALRTVRGIRHKRRINLVNKQATVHRTVSDEVNKRISLILFFYLIKLIAKLGYPKYFNSVFS
jgi:hypothetical protein